MYELVFEWLREKKIADDYLRQPARLGNTSVRNWTPDPRRMRQVEVRDPQEMEDSFWTMEGDSDPQTVNQVGKQPFRRNTQNDSPKPKEETPSRPDGGKGVGTTGVPQHAETPRSPAVAPPAPPPNVLIRGSTPRPEWST